MKGRLWTIQLYPKLSEIFPEFREWMKQEILEVKKFLKRDYIVLDIGCGWSREIKELTPFCKKIIGIDISPKEIETAKSYLKGTSNVEFFVEDAAKMHFSDEYFDVIISLGNTFGNLDKNKEAVLEEMIRLVKRGGKILISVYSKGSSPKRTEAYKKIGLKIRRIEKGKIVFEEGLISEEFSKDKLKDIFGKFGLKARFIDIGSIGILGVISK